VGDIWVTVNLTRQRSYGEISLAAGRGRRALYCGDDRLAFGTLLRMKAHLYNSRWGKVRWFIQRFGAAELVKKPLRTFCAPLLIPRLPRRTFAFAGAELPYFYHPYNMTWACERCLEVPLGRHYLERFVGRKILEVGHVLGHYGPVQHDVLDKFERAHGVHNEDIITFTPKYRYDLILSLSTFEHIGFDDESEGSSAEKIIEAISACRRLLSPEGLLFLTVPVGYNPALDSLIRSGQWPATRAWFYRRRTFAVWEEAERRDALACRYKTPFPYANAIVAAEFGPMLAGEQTPTPASPTA
jgi:hypothetical protein